MLPFPLGIMMLIIRQSRKADKLFAKQDVAGDVTGSSLRLAFPRLLEPLPDRQSEPRQHSPAVQRIFLREEANIRRAHVDAHRPCLRLDIPDQLHAGGEVFPQLVPISLSVLLSL